MKYRLYDFGPSTRYFGVCALRTPPQRTAHSKAVAPNPKRKVLAPSILTSWPIAIWPDNTPERLQTPDYALPVRLLKRLARSGKQATPFVHFAAALRARPPTPERMPQ